MKHHCPKTGQSLGSKIKTKYVEGTINMWSAYCTDEGYDYQEWGQTEKEAITNLCTIHPQLQKHLLL